MDGGYVKGDGEGNKGEGGGPRGKAVAIVNTSFIHHLTYGNTLFVHRQKFASVTLVGYIGDYSETGSKMEFKLIDLEDTPVKVQKWKTNDGDLESRPFQDGDLVRVFGNPRRAATSPDPFIIAYQIIPVLKANELTMHCIEVVASSILLNKRKNNVLAGLPAHSGLTAVPSSQRSSRPSMTPRSNQSQRNQEAPIVTPGMKKTDDIVLKAIAACPDPAGISRDAIFKSLPALNQAAIMTALDFLMTEGHIYTTTDDYHYKSTDG